ncbi:MAG: glycosyltransferase WbuB [Bacteroidetes bacterium HGW-Bacteroidetes-10]|nr:MAG: glycosyltransferase WbuB [Bacteroidetes bacterium HGW-Bacteroidetes-10]
MKVLLVTQYFSPENFKSNDIAFELAKRGYDIDVLTGIPNYPEGKYYKGFGLFRKRVEKINGVRVYRSFQFSRGQNKQWRLALNYLSFAFFASIWALFLSLFKHYDCVIVHAPSPIIQALPGILVKKIQRIPLYLWVLDLWPEAMQSGGGIQNKRILTTIENIVKFIYTNSTNILISSEEFRIPILKKGNYNEKIEYFPNWSEDLLFMRQDFDIPALPKGFIIMLAGNLGKSQDLDAVLKAAMEMKNSNNIKWVLIGDGSKKSWIDDAIVKKDLQDNVFTLGRFPFEYMPTFFKSADALLITLSGEYPDLKLVVPARLQSYMAAGRPVLAMIDGAGADLIHKANCGYSVKSGDYISLARIIRDKVFSDLETFEKLGLNGRKYFEKHFQKNKCINHLCKIIDSK